jgi:hypothetical protein
LKYFLSGTSTSKTYDINVGIKLLISCIHKVIIDCEIE